jgi:uncharacterized protein (TIGR00251 family)
VRVKPRSRRDRVGGSWGAEPSLVVEVRAPPTDGRANAAAVTALARALGIPRGSVEVVHGRRGRQKVFQIHEAPDDIEARVAELLADE